MKLSIALAQATGCACAAAATDSFRQDRPNSQLSNKQVEQLCALDADGRQLLEQALARLRLSARAYHRVLKVARTIADLAGAEAMAATHLGEAIQYRALDRHIP